MRNSVDEHKYSEAEALFNIVLNGRRKVLGPEHPDTTNVLDWLGRMRLEQQRYPEAEVLLREALSGQEKKNPDAWERFDSQSMLGASLAGEGKYEEAEPLLLAGHQGLAQRGSTIPVANHSALESAGQRIVKFYQDWGKREKAAEWQSKLRQSAPAKPLQKP